jgi:hypothetical protein
MTRMTMTRMTGFNPKPYRRDPATRISIFESLDV